MQNIWCCIAQAGYFRQILHAFQRIHANFMNALGDSAGLQLRSGALGTCRARGGGCDGR